MAFNGFSVCVNVLASVCFLFSLAFFTSLFCPILVCFYFLICTIILDTSLYSNERERKGIDLGR